MILSDADILSYMQSGEISITPFDRTRLNPASYTLSLATNVYMPRAGGVIDPDATKNISYNEIEIGERGFVINPGDFLIASVAERLTLPKSCAARLDARTRLARLGLNVLQGSTHIEPGQRDSNETLEIHHIGPRPVCVRAGMKIAKVVFEQLRSPATRGYAGQYLSQTEGRFRH